MKEERERDDIPQWNKGVCVCVCVCVCACVRVYYLPIFVSCFNVRTIVSAL